MAWNCLTLHDVFIAFACVVEVPLLNLENSNDILKHKTALQEKRINNKSNLLLKILKKCVIFMMHKMHKLITLCKFHVEKEKN